MYSIEKSNLMLICQLTATFQDNSLFLKRFGLVDRAKFNFVARTPRWNTETPITHSFLIRLLLRHHYLHIIAAGRRRARNKIIEMNLEPDMRRRYWLTILYVCIYLDLLIQSRQLLRMRKSTEVLRPHKSYSLPLCWAICFTLSIIIFTQCSHQ